MATAEPGNRSYYLDDFAGEWLPCETTLEGWAEWLASPPDENDWREPVTDGDTFAGSALLWQDDIIATRAPDGTWSLSRDPADDDFCAVRFSEGSGWAAESIIHPEPEFNGTAYVINQTMGQAIVAFLEDENECCDDVEHIAVGRNERWQFTYRANPPRLEAARVQ